MSDEKITISLEDVNSAQVDAAVKRQEIATRMAAHQATVQSTTSDAKRMNPCGLFRRSIVYMAVFGLAASLIGWGLGEIVENCGNGNLVLWQILIAMVISLGLAVAEPVVSKNVRMALVNAILGVVLGCLGGFFVSLFANDVYHLLGGGIKGSGFGSGHPGGEIHLL